MSVKVKYNPNHAANVAKAKLAELPPLLSRWNAFQLISLLSPTRNLVRLHHDYGAPLTPGTRIIRIQRGRLDGQLTLAMHRSYVGAMGNHFRKQVWGEVPVLAVGLSIDCARGLQTTCPQRLLPPFDSLCDSERVHGILAGELLAHLAAVPLEVPLALHAYQDWKRGYAPKQVHIIERVEGRAEAVLTVLNQLYGYDIHKAKDNTSSRSFDELHAADHGFAQAAGPARGAGIFAGQAQAGAASPLFAEREQ